MINFDIQRWRHYAHKFDKHGICVIPEPFTEGFTDALNSEVYELLSRAKRRDQCIDENNQLPGSYHSVRRDEIRQYDGMIRRLFESNDVLTVFSYVAGEPIHRVPKASEEYAINSQTTINDNYGWHCDEYSYALTYCVDEPDPMSEVRMEYIPNVKWRPDNADECVRQALLENTVKSVHLKKNHCYFMKTNTTLHRASAMKEQTKRTILVMTFASSADLSNVTLRRDRAKTNKDWVGF